MRHTSLPLLVGFFFLLLKSTASSGEGVGPGRIAEDKPFTSVESILATIPSAVTLKTGGKWNVVGVEQADAAIAQHVLGKLAILRLKFEVFEPFKEGGFAYRIKAPDDDAPARGTRLPYRIWAYFRADQAEALGKLHRGSVAVIRGKLGRADIRLYDGRPGLSLDLVDAEVEPQR